MRAYFLLAIALPAAAAACGQVAVVTAPPEAGGAAGSVAGDAEVDAPTQDDAGDAAPDALDGAVSCTNDSDCPTGDPATCGAKCVDDHCVFAPAGVACDCPWKTQLIFGACDGHGGCVVCGYAVPLGAPGGGCTDDSQCCMWWDQNITDPPPGPYNWKYDSCSDNHVCESCAEPGHLCDDEHHCCSGSCDWARNRCP